MQSIPLSQPDITDRERLAVAKVLETTQLALGPRITAFEQALADRAGRKHGVAVNSGTSALHLIVRGLGLGEGDEVITTPFSFIASTNCLLFERVRPVFVDVDPRTGNIDPSLIEAAVTERTAGLLVVDVFGQSADWDAVMPVAERHGLKVIEDSCEALGGAWKGRPLGSFGDAGCFAFYPNKQITTGEGGVVVTDSDELAAVCRSMSNQGRGTTPDGWLQHVRLGYNYRISDISAALGTAQMERLDEILAARAGAAGLYNERLGDLVGRFGIELPAVVDGVTMSWFVYVIRLAEGSTADQRDKVIAHLRSKGIGCSNYFAPIHLQPFYREQFGYAEGDFPVTESLGARGIALPFFNKLSPTQADRVVAVLTEALGA